MSHSHDDNQIALHTLQAEIRSCVRCVDAGHIAAAFPILHGSHHAHVMIVGQAPGATAAERPLPYSGATGRTLRGWLSRAGLPADSLHDPDRFYLTSLTKCFPGKARQGDGDRAPSRAEIALCSEHLARELLLVQPNLILALGRLSIDAFLPSCRRQALTELVGTLRQSEHLAAPRALVLPLPHPSGVSRWHNSPENRERVSLALSLLAEMAHRRGTPQTEAPLLAGEGLG